MILKSCENFYDVVFKILHVVIMTGFGARKFGDWTGYFDKIYKFIVTALINVVTEIPLL
jgi:hypothetical protein